MEQLPAPLVYLLISWGVITSLLVVLLIYRATLSTREDDLLYLNKAEASMMAPEQQLIVAKLNRLGLPILLLSILSGILLVASGGLWLWIGLKSF
jgi:hypothetical protein